MTAFSDLPVKYEVIDDVGHLNEGETDTAKINVTGYLDGDLADDGTTPVTAVEQVTSDLTITNAVVNTATQTIKGKSVVAGKAINFTVSGQLKSNEPYWILVTFVTDSSPIRTRNFLYKICVK